MVGEVGRHGVGPGGEEGGIPTPGHSACREEKSLPSLIDGWEGACKGKVQKGVQRKRKEKQDRDRELDR